MVPNDHQPYLEKDAMNYKIISACNIEMLEQNIDKLTSSGWEPIGGAFVVCEFTGVVAQAVIRKDREPIKEPYEFQ